jgi:hypothetical protein
MSPSFLDLAEHYNWCRILTAELDNHPKKKGSIKFYKTSHKIRRWVAQGMAAEDRRNSAAGNTTYRVLSSGITGQYPIFIRP